MFSLFRKSTWQGHLSLFSQGENGVFTEKRRVFRGAPEVPPDATPEQRDKYFDKERIARAKPIKGDHAGVRQVVEEQEKKRQEGSALSPAEQQRVYGEVREAKADSLKQRKAKTSLEWSVNSTALEGKIPTITITLPPVFNDRADFYPPAGASTINLTRISIKLSKIDAEILRINNLPSPSSDDITTLKLLYDYRAVCQLAMKFHRLGSVKVLLEKDKTNIPTDLLRVGEEITQLINDRNLITLTDANIPPIRAAISTQESLIVQLEQSLLMLKKRASDPTAPLPSPIPGLTPPLTTTPTPAAINTAITTVENTLIKNEKNRLEALKEILANIQLSVFLKETLLPLQLRRAGGERAILIFIQSLPATLTQTHIDTFAQYTKHIHDLNKELENAKRAADLPDEGTIQRKTLDRIIEGEEDLLEDAQDALALQLMANGVDPVLIYNLGNFAADGTFRTSFSNLINPFRTTREEALREAQDKARKVLRKNGVPPDVEDFFLELVVVHGEIAPADLERAFKDDKNSMAIIVSSISESTLPATRNPSIRPSSIRLPTAPSGSIIDKINNSIINHGREYINAKRESREKLREGITTYEETSFEKEYGFRIRSARDNYIRAKDKFSALGFLHTVWFDASGGFTFDGTKQNEIRALLLDTIPGFRPNSGFTSVDEFVDALFDTTDPKHNDSKVCMIALKDDITEWEQQEDGRIHAQKTGMEYLTNNAQNIFEKGAEGIVDMFTSGEPAQMAAAGVLIYMFIKGFTNKKTGMLFKGAAGLWAADYFAKTTFNFDALDEFGITSALSPIVGSAPKAWEETLRRRGSVTDFEKTALAAEGMKTRALIALGEVPLEELLNWHREVSMAKTADSNVKKKALEEKIPPELKKSLGRIARSGDKFEATEVAFGLLSLSLRESAAREGYEGVSGEHAADIARMLVRAKYFHKKETGFDSISKTEEKTVIDNVFDSYQQENHGTAFTFGMFVEKEIGPSEVALSKKLDDTWVQRTMEGAGEIGADLYNRLKDGYKGTEKLLSETIVKIFHVWGPDAISFITDMTGKGWRLAASAGNEINLLWQTHKVTITEIASGTWGILVDGFLLPFKGGYEIFKVVKDNIPTIMSIINTTKTIVETSIENLFGLNESREQVSITSAEDLYTALEDLKLDKAVIEAYGLPEFMTQTIGGQTRNVALLQLCETIFNDHRNAFKSKLESSMMRQEIDRYAAGDITWRDSTGTQRTSTDIKFNTLQDIPRGAIGKYFLTDIWMVSLANRTVDQAAKIFAKVPQTIKTIGGMDSNILLTAANEMANGIFAIRNGRAPNATERDPFGTPNNPANANNTFLQEYAPWLDAFTPVGGPNLAKVKTFASDVEGIINSIPETMTPRTITTKITDIGKTNHDTVALPLPNPLPTPPPPQFHKPNIGATDLDTANRETTQFIWTRDNYHKMVDQVALTITSDAVKQAFLLLAKNEDNMAMLFQKVTPSSTDGALLTFIYGDTFANPTPPPAHRYTGLIAPETIRDALQNRVLPAVQLYINHPSLTKPGMHLRFMWRDPRNARFHQHFSGTVNNPITTPFDVEAF